MEKLQKMQRYQEAAEEANRANRAKSAFLSHVSHDIRTPLNVILAYSNPEIVKDASPEQLRDYLEKINLSGGYLRGIVNDVLDISKIEQNQFVLKPEPYSLALFEKNIRNVIGELCKDKSIEFVFDTGNMKAIGIVTDCVRFNQIFMNLLSNAVKFTPEKGKVEFIMEQIGENEGAAEIQFTVRDNGIGMSSDFIPRAFESFSQEYREDVAENCEGTGLGLSIVQELVKMMGGSIQMESVLNRGTVFKVFLPLQETDLCSGSQNVIEVDSDKLRGMHILLAEDNDLNKEIAVVMLEKKGCIVDWANNGRAVCDIFEKSPSGYYRIILMDVRMPYMDGLSASRNIRRMKRADAKSIPIISMSADAFVEDEKAAYEAGMNDCITKPVEAHRLYEICIKYA